MLQFFTCSKNSSAALSGRVTPALPPIEYDLVQSSAELSTPRNVKLAPKGKSGIPVFTGRKTPTNFNSGFKESRNQRSPLMRGKSLNKDEPNYARAGNKFRAGGAMSRAGNHPRLNRANSENSITRLPPISPRNRRRIS